MHGIIFAELKKYVVSRLGAEAWNKLLLAAGYAGRVYLPTHVYPDKEIQDLVATASKTTGRDPQAILEDFGEFIAPDLLQMYATQINPAWRTLELIEHTEETIHRVVRLKDPKAKPPELVCTRGAPDSVTIVYRSPRHMCGVARGISRGVAKHYKERVDITEPRCMLRGDPACEIGVRLVR